MRTGIRSLTVLALILLTLFMSMPAFTPMFIRHGRSMQRFSTSMSRPVFQPPMQFRNLPDDTIFLLDGTSLLFTSHYSREVAAEYADATAKFPVSETELPCGALIGLALHFSRLVRDLKPKYIVAAFDFGSTTFRHEIYPEYKSQRKDAPVELTHQFEYAAPMLQSLGCHCITKEGFEADDILATLASWAKNRHLNAVIVSPDKDMYQLVTNGVHVMHPKTKNITGVDEVVEKFGVPPHRFTDYQALAGDASDNIPGVKGVGPKTAAALVQKYESIEDLYSVLAPAMESFSIADADSHEMVIPKVKKGTSNKKVSEEYAKVLEKFANDLSGVRCSPSKLLNSFFKMPLSTIQTFKKLVSLKTDVDIILPLQNHLGSSESIPLTDATTAHFRYIGEAVPAEPFFSSLGALQHFQKPLLLLRTQYHKLDRLL